RRKCNTNSRAVAAFDSERRGRSPTRADQVGAAGNSAVRRDDDGAGAVNGDHTKIEAIVQIQRQLLENLGGGGGGFGHGMRRGSHAKSGSNSDASGAQTNRFQHSSGPFQAKLNAR